MLTSKRLQYLALRLAKIDALECKIASDVVLEAITQCGDLECNGPDEYDLYQTVLEHISRALASGQYLGYQELELDALEAEMIGYLGGIRLARSKLTEPEDQPYQFPNKKLSWNRLRSYFLIDILSRKNSGNDVATVEVSHS